MTSPLRHVADAHTARLLAVTWKNKEGAPKRPQKPIAGEPAHRRRPRNQVKKQPVRAGLEVVLQRELDDPVTAFIRYLTEVGYRVVRVLIPARGVTDVVNGASQAVRDVVHVFDTLCIERQINVAVRRI